MWKCFLGAFLGLMAAIAVSAALIAFVIWLLPGKAEAHDQISVNVRDHHTYTRRSGHNNEAITDMLLIFNHDQHIPVVTYVDDSVAEEWCADSNNYLRALKAMVDEEVAKSPEFAETYQVSYDSIERAWCK